MKKIEKYIIAVVVLVAVGAIGTAIYFGVNRENNTNNSVNEFEKENEKELIDIQVNDSSKEVINYKNYTDVINDCGEEGQNCYYNYTFEQQKDYKSSVSIEDTYAVSVSASENNVAELELYMLYNGKVYYTYVEDNDNDNNFEYTKYRVSDYFENSQYNKVKNELKEISNISEIKRIKGFNSGHGVDYGVLLITESGVLYELDILIDGEVFLKKVEELSKYKVDDVIQYVSGLEYGSKYKVILDDGTILTKSLTINN